jgi:hypothetical protein
MLWPSSVTGPLSQWAKCPRKLGMTDEGQERHLCSAAKRPPQKGALLRDITRRVRQ